jgi:conjugative relaxase-like TrwC/TraI family protein
MLRIINGTAGNSTGAANYFNDGLAKSDYFTEQETITGRWYGQTKSLLGLGDTVEAQEFKNLVAGLDPHSEEKLTARMRKNRIAGAEFTFSCSKSISIL